MNNLKKTSLKHQIAGEIRKAIFMGQLSPGEKVTETKISEDLEVSRGPIREAMQLLVMEGLLISTAYKETKVSHITTEEVTELLVPMRVNIETFALKNTLPLWEQKDFDKFERIVEQMRRAAIFNDHLLFSDLDMQFHELIISSSNMSNVESLWDGIFNRIRLLFSYQKEQSLDLQKHTEDHRFVLDAFKTRDVDEAIQSLKKHIIETNTPVNMTNSHFRKH
ncbi:GntR family transcriptional regulator [Salicibibacter cibarius]|uniref:GntR family transcriptional regulator n=1 Tax=Salicibibacter cibarius TaxID=2743000 RepID=A0A7T7CBQ8_9BACI|nr:GntR family transcriptional regulator [Salicibibacter cibarius]QQK76244.1 GntR family transcriptional regulator [Salicibibacter cibarius]